MRRTVAVLLAGLCLVAFGRGSAQESSVGPGDAVAEALAAARDVEKELLTEQLERYRALARVRSEALARLAQSHQSLEAEVGRGAEAVPDRVEELLEQAEQAHRDVEARLGLERIVAARAREHLRRIALLERRMEGRKGGDREEERGGVLSGSWDLVLLPLEQRGSCVLQHSGAVVNGTYRLEGGYTGSLQGTLVERKVYLVRIDTQLGKIMELEGFLSADGKQMRGTWLNYELAGAEGSTGHWSATRRPPHP